MGKEKLRVAALTSGKNVPSARFRVRQHINNLKFYNIYVREYVPLINKYLNIPPDYFGKLLMPLAKSFSFALNSFKLLTRIPGVLGSWDRDITWLQKDIIPIHYTLERFLKRPIIFDVDDAIWAINENAEQASRKIAIKSDLIIVGNNYLANWYSKYNSNIEIIPTSLDTEKLKFNPKKRDNRYYVGWTGTSSNYEYLYDIEESLYYLTEKYSDIKLLIISDKKPFFKKIKNENIKFIKWRERDEIKYLYDIDLGIMPLKNNIWTNGKCSFKMLQYMSIGLPVVVSPVGMNREILNLSEVGLPARNIDEWINAIEFFYKNPAISLKFGKNGRIIVENNFSNKIIAGKLAKAFHKF